VRLPASPTVYLLCFPPSPHLGLTTRRTTLLSLSSSRLAFFDTIWPRITLASPQRSNIPFPHLAKLYRRVLAGLVPVPHTPFPSQPPDLPCSFACELLLWACFRVNDLGTICGGSRSRAQPDHRTKLDSYIVLPRSSHFLVANWRLLDPNRPLDHLALQKVGTSPSQIPELWSRID
jgi:hypothetical protein